MTKEFEEGRKFQRLEGQIKAIAQEIESARPIQSMDVTRSDLRERIGGVFEEYLSLAQKYRVSRDEIRKVSEIYERAFRQ
jgi:DNA-binding FrmR family transcriptional regulator